jgi:Flp pilus assembly pilin Flp
MKTHGKTANRHSVALERGQGITEYALLLVLVAIIAAGTIVLLAPPDNWTGGALGGVFNSLRCSLEASNVRPIKLDDDGNPVYVTLPYNFNDGEVGVEPIYDPTATEQKYVIILEVDVAQWCEDRYGITGVTGLLPKDSLGSGNTSNTGGSGTNSNSGTTSSTNSNSGTNSNSSRIRSDTKVESRRRRNPATIVASASGSSWRLSPSNTFSRLLGSTFGERAMLGRRVRWP